MNEGRCCGLLLASALLAAELRGHRAGAEQSKVLVLPRAAGRHDHRRRRPPSRRSARRTTSPSTRPPARPTSTPPTSTDYRALVFLNNAGDLLNAAQEAALQGFVQDGSGFLGIGSAAQGRAGRRFFNGLIGARPDAASPTTASQQIVVPGDRVHPSTKACRC